MLTRLIPAALVFFGALNVAWAQDVSPFAGHWKGSGISETDDSIFFAVTVRDMDVVITPGADGAFSLAWTTIMRESGDPNNPEVEKKSAEITFRPWGAPGVYRAVDMGDPLKSEPVWWSRVEGQTLYTYMMLINEDGTWVVQKYTREVTGQGMTVTFERIADGEPVRQVRGRLVKHSN
jgi:hypothetical protein